MLHRTGSIVKALTTALEAKSVCWTKVWIQLAVLVIQKTFVWIIEVKKIKFTRKFNFLKINLFSNIQGEYFYVTAVKSNTKATSNGQNTGTVIKSQQKWKTSNIFFSILKYLGLLIGLSVGFSLIGIVSGSGFTIFYLKKHQKFWIIDSNCNLNVQIYLNEILK